MIMIMIKVMIMNVGYIWLISLNAMQIAIFSAVANDFNQLIYTVYTVGDDENLADRLHVQLVL